MKGFLAKNQEWIQRQSKCFTIVATMIASCSTAFSVDVLTGNILWVDSVNGNDSTAERGKLSQPYLTATAAITNAQSGDMVWIGRGEFSFDRNRYSLPPNVVIRGMGKAATTLYSTNHTMFVLTNQQAFLDLDLICTNNFGPGDIDPDLPAWAVFGCVNAIWVNQGNNATNVVIRGVRATATDMCLFAHYDDGNPPFAGVGSFCTFTIEDSEFSSKHVGLWLQDDGSRSYNTKARNNLIQVNAAGFTNTAYCVWWNASTSDGVFLGNRFSASGGSVSNVCVEVENGIVHLAGNSYTATSPGNKKLVRTSGTGNAVFLDDILNASQVSGYGNNLVELGKLTVQEVDGSPSVSGVQKLIFPNGTLTDNGDKSVTITFP